MQITRREMGWLASGAALDQASEDAYGGLVSERLRATGRFRLENWRGGRWLVTPEGHPFIGVALCHTPMPPESLRVPADRTAEKFGDDLKSYATDTAGWMRSAGFNTYSYGVPREAEGEMNRLNELGLVPGFINGPQFPDFFDPAWRAAAAARIAQLAPPATRDPRVIGHVLSPPLLFSPVMERPRIWRHGELKRQNYMMAVRAGARGSAAKREYVGYLRRKYLSFASYKAKRGAPGGASSFDDLLPADLSAHDDYAVLHPDDAAFYTYLWDSLTGFLTSEIRKHDSSGLIFSYRFIRVLKWPDPWLEAMLAGVGRHVDAFAVELYGDNPYREIVDGIGLLTGKPSFILDGMRPREFVYAGEISDEDEAASYRTMYQSLMASPWLIGTSVCEYRQKYPNNPFYSPRPKEARTGVRNPDYTERAALVAAFRDSHARRYRLRLEGLERSHRLR